MSIEKINPAELAAPIGFSHAELLSNLKKS